jgi:hypothetical protein
MSVEIDTQDYESKIAEIKASDLPFQKQIEAIKAARKEFVELRTSDMMTQLDYSKHDKRNGKAFVKAALTAHYTSCLDSVVTPAQWDETFSYYSPYSGTY